MDKWGVRHSFTAATVLGAYRTGEFIPWDDDVDVRVHDDDWKTLQHGLITEGTEVDYAFRDKLVRTHSTSVPHSIVNGVGSVLHTV